MNGWWAGAVAALGIAVLAGIGDRRRRNRSDPDRIGWVDWPALQMLAVIVGLACVALAWRG